MESPGKTPAKKTFVYQFLTCYLLGSPVYIRTVLDPKCTSTCPSLTYPSLFLIARYSVKSKETVSSDDEELPAEEERKVETSKVSQTYVLSILCMAFLASHSRPHKTSQAAGGQGS